MWVRKSSSSENKQRFNFEEIWALDAKCRDLITASWSSSYCQPGAKSIIDKLGTCAKRIDKWGFKKYGGRRREIRRLKKEIELKKAYSSYGLSISSIVALEKRLDILQNHEEIYWKQRSRIDWLAYGDRNSRVFHLKASERKKKNRIEGLIDNAGTWCTSSIIVTDHCRIFSFYFLIFYSFCF